MTERQQIYSSHTKEVTGSPCQYTTFHEKKKKRIKKNGKIQCDRIGQNKSAYKSSTARIKLTESKKSKKKKVEENHYTKSKPPKKKKNSKNNNVALFFLRYEDSSNKLNRVKNTYKCNFIRPTYNCQSFFFLSIRLFMLFICLATLTTNLKA